MFPWNLVVWRVVKRGWWSQSTSLQKHCLRHPFVSVLGISGESQLAPDLLVSDAFPENGRAAVVKSCLPGVKHWCCVGEAAGPPRALVTLLLSANRRFGWAAPVCSF